ncbi:MAG: hypothetical protein GTO04_14155, partial [Planctomycetales bacterium]|nr:hypothetical protein [Planctomycetales bacterium]
KLKVRVAVVQQEQTDAALTALQRHALSVTSQPQAYLNQVVVELEVAAASLAGIARIPSVIWIEQVVGAAHRDEVQNLVTASFTSGPGNGPDPGPPPESYTNFLATVGTAGFSTDPSQYPVVDVADSGLDNGSVYPYHPDFYEVNLGVADFISGWNAFHNEDFSSCTTNLPQTRVAYNLAPDIDGHGTFVASIVGGFNDKP